MNIIDKINKTQFNIDVAELLEELLAHRSMQKVCYTAVEEGIGKFDGNDIYRITAITESDGIEVSGVISRKRFNAYCAKLNLSKVTDVIGMEGKAYIVSGQSPEKIRKKWAQIDLDEGEFVSSDGKVHIQWPYLTDDGGTIIDYD